MSRKVITSIKGIMNEAVRLGLTQYNPATSVRIKKARRSGDPAFAAPPPLSSIPTKDEIRSLLQASEHMFPRRDASNDALTGWCIGTWWHAFFVLAVFSGMRSSELRGLVWNNVDLSAGFVRVRQRADFRNNLGPPKSAAANRDIPMAPVVLSILSEWRQRCPTSPLSLVFPSRNRRIHTNSNIHKMCWGPLQMAAGVTKLVRARDGTQVLRPRLAFHSLRHAAATLFISEGWQAKKVQAVMGHSSIQVTYDIYGKLWSDPQADLAAMAALQQRLIG